MSTPMQSPDQIVKLAHRYLRARVGVGSRAAGTELDMDELEPLLEFVRRKFSEDEKVVLYVYSEIDREYTRGHRCSVCGRTSRQNEELGYDCVREC